MPITPKASFTKDNKYIWSAEEVFGLGDTRCDYIHQFKGYETDKGWNITVQAIIPTTSHGYFWTTTRRYFKKSRFPYAQTVKQAIQEVAELPSMIEPLTTEYEGYKVVDKARKSGITKEQLKKIQSQMDNKYSKGWLYKNPAAQKEALEIINGIKS